MNSQDRNERKTCFRACYFQQFNHGRRTMLNVWFAVLLLKWWYSQKSIGDYLQAKSARFDSRQILQNTHS